MLHAGLLKTLLLSALLGIETPFAESLLACPICRFFRCFAVVEK
jgi:hypothetical protein